MAETQSIASHSEGGPVVAKHGPVYVSGAIYKIEQHSKDVFEVTQVEEQDHFAAAPPPPGYDPFDINIGPVRIRGYFNRTTLSFIVTAYVLGVKIGEFSGNLNDLVGREIKLDTRLAKGSIRFFTKTKSDLWVHVKVTVLGSKEFDKEFQIFPR